jgi:hypothetical protein
MFGLKSALTPNDENQVALKKWMQAELIPFYDKWMNEIDSLSLDRRHLTAERQILLMNSLRKQRDNYQLLLDEFDTTGRMNSRRCRWDNDSLRISYILDRMKLKRMRIH